MRRNIAAFLVAVLALFNVVPPDCAGWQLTAKGRMDCCARAQHECAGQAMADNCCKRAEERQQERVTPSPFVLASISVAGLFTFVTNVLDSSAISARALASHIDGRPQRPTYLLTSALLI